MSNNSYQKISVANAKDCISDIDAELNLQSVSGDKSSDYLKMNSEEHSLKSMQNISTLPILPLISHEPVLLINEFDSSSLDSVECTDSLLLEKIDCLLQKETIPFHREISNSIQELLIEMKVLLNNLKNGMNSVTDPDALSKITRCQVIRQYLEKIILVELKKLEHCKVEKQHFEEYTYHMKSFAFKQDKLVNSILEKCNSCVIENKSLHEKLRRLKNKLQSFGLLKPQGESNCEKTNHVLDVVKIPEDINLPFQHNNDMPNDYLECLQIFKASSTNLHNLYIQAEKLQLLSDSSHKLSDNLISRIQDQELHMKSITKQLEEAHNLLAAMKKQHKKLQSAENIVKYDLQEKRRFLNKLKLQLEATRENCDLVKVKNSKSEADWQDLRKEFVQRNKQTSEESGFNDDRGEESSFNECKVEESDLVGDESKDNALIYECITDENCIVGNIACEIEDPKNVPDSEVSMNNNDIESKYELRRIRLQLLEEQCNILCTNLKNNSNKGKELDYRLESWCKAIKSSRNKASKKNLSVDKDNSDKVESIKFDVDFNSDVDSSLSSPEIDGFDPESCSYILLGSSASSKIVDLENNKISFEHDQQHSIDFDPMSEDFHDNCNSMTTENVQDSSYGGSIESLGEGEKCQVEIRRDVDQDKS